MATWRGHNPNKPPGAVDIYTSLKAFDVAIETDETLKLKVLRVLLNLEMELNSAPIFEES